MLLGSADGSTYAYLYFQDNAAIAQTVSGTGSIVFGGNGSSTIQNYMASGGGTGATGTLTIGPGITIHGKYGQINNAYAQGRIVNQGKISADTSGGAIYLGNSTGGYSSTGTLEAKS